MMMNRLKNNDFIPSFMRKTRITPIHKKGPRVNIENFRGVNRVNVIGSIYMRMIYNLKYEEIDKNISESQMGGRKFKGCRNNIFIINGIIHDIKNNKNAKDAIFQIVDYKEKFDTIQIQQALIDL